MVMAGILSAAPPPVVPATEITPARVIELMNAYRGHFGLEPLREDPRLDEAAADRIQDMEDLGYWSHVSPDGRPPFGWIEKRGYRYHYAGENLARGYETAELLVESWMESPGHRENILSPNFRDAGVAVIDGSTTRRERGKSVVVLFGREMSGEAQ